MNKQNAGFLFHSKVPSQGGIRILQRRQCIRSVGLATVQCVEAEKSEEEKGAEGTIDIIRCQVMTVNVPHEGFYAK